MGRHQELEPGVSADVHDALGEDLDAYLDRELLRQPAPPEPKPAPRAVPAPRKPRKSLQGMLALAAEEERWLCSKPAPDGGSESPPLVREAGSGKKPPEVTQTQTTQVLLPELAWGDAPEPASEEERDALQKPWRTLEDTLRPPAPRRRLGPVLLGVGALGVVAVGAFWAMRPAQPDAQKVRVADVPAGPAAVVAQAPERPEPVPEPPRPKPPVRQAAATPEPVKPVAKAPGPTAAKTAAVAPVAKATPAPVTPAPEPSKLDSAEDLDAEFAQKLSVADKRAAPAPKRAAPGWGPSRVEEEDLGDSSDASSRSDLPERLDPSEIQRVVVANQPAIASCIRRHKEATGSEGGSFVLRWTILSSGSTAQVGMATEEMRGTPLSRCIEGLVKGWKFPRHRVQQAPIQFPFRF